MQYLKRKIDSYLLNWKNDPNKMPLIVAGARQVGKTASIRHFAQSQYTSFVEINFVTNPGYKAITKEGYDPKTIRRNLSMINPSLQFIPGKTLLFFDEVQAFPEITTSLKFFKEEGQYDVICSGSLLGVNAHHIDSISVGAKIDKLMWSMDFEEYLWARGYKEDFVEEIFQHMRSATALSQLALETLQKLFLDYVLTGGMPRVVATFIEQQNFSGILGMQRQLLSDYKSDVRKYSEGTEQTRIINVLNRIPAQLAMENKKFQISKVAQGARARDYWGCVEWLHDAGIITICHCLQTPNLPIRGNTDDNKYKLYYADTGLLIANLDDEASTDLRVHKNMGVYRGALYEQFVSEALVKQDYPLVYYKRPDSTLEEDFFVRTSKHLIPVEVKTTGGQAKSLRTLIDSSSYPDISFGIKFTGGNIGFEQNIYTFPWACTFLLKRFLSELE